jgi:hypothetical protein
MTRAVLQTKRRKRVGRKRNNQGQLSRDLPLFAEKQNLALGYMASQGQLRESRGLTYRQNAREGGPQLLRGRKKEKGSALSPKARGRKTRPKTNEELPIPTRIACYPDYCPVVFLSFLAIVRCILY